VVADPVVRPEASRYVVRVLLPLVWLVEVPMVRPEASRMTERTVPLLLF
jgi:hypothetical protein